MSFAVGIFWMTLRHSKTTGILPTHTTRRITAVPRFANQLARDVQASDERLVDSETAAPCASAAVCAWPSWGDDDNTAHSVHDERWMPPSGIVPDQTWGGWSAYESEPAAHTELASKSSGGESSPATGSQQSTQSESTPHDCLTTAMVRGQTLAVHTLQFPSHSFASSPPHAFNLHSVLGSGSFGTVVLADTADEQCRRVALKIVDKDSGYDEARLHSSLRHPNILPIYGYFSHSHWLVLVVAFCPDGDLSTHNRSTVLSERAVASLAQDILRGLAYLHGRGIVHGDLKPGNTLLGAPGERAMIADFGCAVPRSEWSQRFPGGTPQYRAPEVTFEQPYCTQSDMWSFGVTVFRLLFDQMPFAAEYDYAHISCADITYPAQDEHEVSQAGVDFVRRLLRRDPAQRMTANDAMSHAWMQQGASC